MNENNGLFARIAQWFRREWRTHWQETDLRGVTRFKFAWKRALPVIGVLAILIAIVADFSVSQRNASYSDLLATNLGVNLDTDDESFDGTVELDGVALLSQRYLQENLQVTPDASFTVNKRRDDDDTATVTILNPKRVAYTLSLVEPYQHKTLEWQIPAPPMTIDVPETEIGLVGPIAIHFSDPVDEDNLMENLFISPAINYKLSVAGSLVYVNPIGELKEDAAYTLTIRTGLVSKNGNPLPHTFRVVLRTTAGESAEPVFTVKLSGNYSRVAASTEDITLDFESKNIGEEELPLTITTYRFEDTSRYLAQAQMLVDYSFEPADILERIDVNLALLEEGEQTITLPNPGAGGYLVEAVAKDPETEETVRMRRAVFVTDLSLYMQSMGSDTLAWVNSAATGQPIPGYTVEFIRPGETEPFTTAVTDSDGVAMLDRMMEEGEDGVESYYYSYYYMEGEYENLYSLQLRDRDGVVQYIDASGIIAPMQHYDNHRDRFYTYFYSDRAIYKPTDEINFWGYVSPYSGNRMPMPESVTVYLDGSQATPMTVPVDANGTFYGVIDYESIRSSQYMLAAEFAVPVEYASEYEMELARERGTPEAPTRTLDSVYLDIKEYEKPLFAISTATDKEYYSNDDTVTLTITPKFYDGTPLPNYPLELTTYSSYYGTEVETMKITTDEHGVAVVKFPADQTNQDEIGWGPVMTRYRVQVASDGQDIKHYGSYTYFPSDLLLTGNIQRQSDGNLTVAVNANRLNYRDGMNISGIQNYIAYSHRSETADEYYEKFEPFRGDPVDTEITITMDYSYRDWQGTRYNNQWRVEKPQTVNGAVSIPDALPEDLDPGRPYSLTVKIGALDGAGRSVIFSTRYYYWPTGWREEDSEDDMEGFIFLVEDGSGTAQELRYNEWMDYNTVYFGDRQAMNFQLLKDGEPTESTGRILYTLYQDGVIQRGISTSNTLRFTQKVDWAQSTMLIAAYFDGREVHPIRNTVIYFNMDSIKVDIDVAADRESYTPGDTVNLTVAVTEAETGSPVRGNALVSVVDEAVFALREQYVNVLNSLYSDMYFSMPYIPKYTTTAGDLPRVGVGDGGKGDGDGADFYDMLRKNFKDTAAFLPVRTGADGRATLSFQLPDNITSWRITSLAVGDQMYAGNAKHNIISTMPFFMNPVVSSKYIEGDDVAMLVQGHGTLLDEKSEISYTVRLQGDGFDQTLSADGLAYVAQELNFGKLPVGEYTLSATAQHAGYRDTVELPVAVVSSSLELVVNKKLDLSQPLDINAMRYPVTISFYHQEYDAYYSSISSLLTHYCMIANQRMSRFVAKRSLTQHMDPENIPMHIREGNESASDMQNDDGGIGWNVGDDSNPLLTTKVLLVAFDQFNHKSMAEYLHAQVGTAHAKATKNDASALLGLAALGEDVTGTIEKFLAADCNDETRAYLVAALAYAGETERAMEAYEKAFASLRKTSPQGGVHFGEDEVTAAVWIAASRLGHEDADLISIYFARDPWRIDTLFECMIYITNYDKDVAPVTVAYTAGGVSESVNLGVKGQRTVSFNRSQMESLQFTSVPEGVGATAYYIGEPDEVGIEASEEISITKKVEKLPGNENRYKFTFTVGLESDAPTGYYDITDWVPSNMRLYQMDLSNPNRNTYWWGHYSTEGQKLNIRIYNNRNSDQTIQFSYIAQKTYDCDAMIDSTYIIHGNTGQNNFTERYLLDK